MVNSGTSNITVPAGYGKLRIWQNTAAASLSGAQTLTLSPGTGTLGYEWDEDLDNGFRPAGEFDLSSTTVSNLQSFTDYGSNVASNATGTHHLTLYRAPSGALVFGAGTVQWSWGLAAQNAWNVGTTDPTNDPPDPNMEQFTVNLLAEMGAQPGTLLEGLQSQTKTTDTAPPASTISSPTAAETVHDGSPVTITGSATDSGGGVVAGVEVSTDNGGTWHPATLTSPDAQTVSWSYAWAAHGYPSTTIKSRAVDDSANLEKPVAGVAVNVSCPCSLWGNAVTPPTPDAQDSHAVTVGVKFTSESFGTITGIRFYKSAANTGTHVGSLWSAAGTLLASATFSGESASGWQQVTFSTPVDVFPNTTYVAGYFAPEGHYAASIDYFNTPAPTGGHIMNSPPLHALGGTNPPVEGLYSSANGVFSYGGTSNFPVSSFNGTNYWVDPVFSPVAAAGAVTSVSATADISSAHLSWSAPGRRRAGDRIPDHPLHRLRSPAAHDRYGHAPAGRRHRRRPQKRQHLHVHGPGRQPQRGGRGLAGVQRRHPLHQQPALGAGQRRRQPRHPPGAGELDRTVEQRRQHRHGLQDHAVCGGDRAGPGRSRRPASPRRSSKASPTASATRSRWRPSTPSAPVRRPAPPRRSPRRTRSSTSPRPRPAVENDSSAVELGVKFSSEEAGSITGIRFYKASTNTGTHVGSLWTAGGTLLATATFTNETTSGWQKVNFAKPVAISANTTYVAGYFAPKGHYSDTQSGLSSAVLNAPLSALSNATSANGLYSLQRRQRVPQLELQSQQLLRRRQLRTGADDASGAGHGRERNGRDRRGERQLERPGERRDGQRIQGHAVHRRPGAGRHDPHRDPSAHERHHHGAETGHGLHLHGAGAELRGRGARVLALQPR